MDKSLSNQNINPFTRRNLNFKVVCLFIFVVITASIISGLAAYKIGSSINQLQPEKLSAGNNAKAEEQLLSPLDNKRVDYSSGQASGLYFSGIPAGIFFEQLDGPSKGRIVVYYGWNVAENRYGKAFFVSEENKGPGLTEILPITKHDGLRFVAEYIGGDAQELKVTTVQVQFDSNIKEIKVGGIDQFYLNGYFPPLSSSIKVIGWLDYNLLLIKQTYSNFILNIDDNKQELYLFDVDAKTRQLIYTTDG